MHAFELAPASPQPIHPGSYVHVDKGLREPLSALTMECWVRTWSLAQPQGLISQGETGARLGLALCLGPKGEVIFFLGDGSSPVEALIHKTQPGVVENHKWHHVVARWDGKIKEVWVDGKLAGQWPFASICAVGTDPIRLGAMSEKGSCDQFLDGDLAAPAIYRRALSPDEITQRLEAKGKIPALDDDMLACWPLSEERGEKIADASRHQRHGRIINHATWMIGGPDFDSTKVPRYGDYDPAKDGTRGHALRFASDDLYDCRWKATHEWNVPVAAKSGLYIGRLHFEMDGKAHDYPVTFIVRRAEASRKAPMLVLCSTSTWLAYNSTPFSHTMPPGTLLTTSGYTNSHGGAPAYSCYRNHRAGQPAYQFGLRMPWPSAGPDVLYSPQSVGYSHLMRAERFLHVWLDKSGYEFDVVSDFDLHRDPDLLKGYRTIVINGHSEYWSRESYDQLDTFLSQGGSALVLSGNTMFWRTTFSDDGSVMECRKLDERIGGRNGAQVG
ncbi:MAG: LamG domain-containing protein, partial [Verrucomicrobiaceae bacterium]